MSLDTEPSSHATVLDAFRQDLGPLWRHIEPWCAGGDDPQDDLRDLVRRLGDKQETATPSGRVLAPDLEALLAGWRHFDAFQRAVLRGAVCYFVEPDDAIPDHVEDGFVDDELVVDAAVRAILRR